jgi:predicted RNase H-like HicB family nuclease
MIVPEGARRHSDIGVGVSTSADRDIGGINGMKYAIVIEHRSGSNYSAYAPDVPGCVATADTLEEVRRLMKEGIEFHLEGMREDGLAIPEPTTAVDYSEVA